MCIIKFAFHSMFNFNLRGDSTALKKGEGGTRTGALPPLNLEGALFCMKMPKAPRRYIVSMIYMILTRRLCVGTSL